MRNGWKTCRVNSMLIAGKSSYKQGKFDEGSL